jgi:predicted transcriptional regulator YheO
MSKALKPYVPVCDGVAQLLFPHAEVVLHDLATGTIAHIANSYSKRRAGDSSLNEPEIELDLTQDVIGPYPKTNWDGRHLKSITSVIRDGRGKAIGLLCINLDTDTIAGAVEMLRGIIALPERPQKPAPLFSGDWREGVNETLGSFLAERNTALAGLRNEDKDELISRLDRHGVFQIRKAVPYVAEILGMSRATVYNRLAVARREVATS